MFEAEEGSATSVEDFVGAAFGDFSSGPAPESGTSATPETPAPSAAPDPAPPDVPTNGTLVDAPPATPAAAPTDAVADPTQTDDPLKDAAPLTYTVDGVTKAYEGIKVLGDVGGIIEPAALKDVQQRLSEHEHFRTANQQLYQKVQQYEALGGEKKVAELSEQLAATNAIGSLLLPMFSGDVNSVLKFLQQNADGTIGWNEDARAVLLDKLVLARDRAEMTARGSFQSSVTQAQSQGQQGQVKAHATQTALQEVRKSYPHWTPDDFAAAEQHLAVYGDYLIRPATEAEAQRYGNGIRAGQLMIDYPRLAAWTEQRNATRAAQAQTAATVTNASKENAARLAAALPGTRKAQAAPAAPQAPSKAKDAEDAWDLRERLASSAMRR